MEQLTEQYLLLCHAVLAHAGDSSSVPDFLAYYEENPDDVTLETDEEGYVYCGFVIPAAPLEDIHVFVFEKEQIIADCNGVHVKVDDIFHKPEVIKRLLDVSDWMMLEGLLAGKIVDPEKQIPNRDDDYEPGEALLVNTAYVTERFRRKGIFRTMTDAARDLASRHVYTDMLFYTVISLDPDVASIGEDAVEEPYYYEREKDDPKRAVNKTIAMHCGMNPVHLDIDNLYDPSSQDGTKEWYAAKMDRITIGRPVMS
jgi:hypothetical protein